MELCQKPGVLFGSNEELLEKKQNSPKKSPGYLPGLLFYSI
jgi:hypothetical protein